MYVPFVADVTNIAKGQEARGADMIKIVSGADDDLQQGENLKMVAITEPVMK